MSDDVRAYRAEQLAKIPRRYSPVLHLVATVGTCLCVIVISAVMIGHFGRTELIVVLLMFVFANGVEWLVHREFLHRSRRFFRVLHVQHAAHHKIYHEQRMGIGRIREWYFVLMPAKAMIGMAFISVPLMLLVGTAFGADAGWSIMLVVGSYSGAYEVVHLCYHLPETHPIRRAMAIRWLARHHARHHRKPSGEEVVKNWNVTVPLADVVFGTRAKES